MHLDTKTGMLVIPQTAQEKQLEAFILITTAMTKFINSLPPDIGGDPEALKQLKDALDIVKGGKQ